MSFSFNKSQAIVKIIGANTIPSKGDRQSYRSLAQYKAGLATAKKNGETNLQELYRKEIQNIRARLRMMRPQEYMFEITLKRYNYKCEVSAQYEVTEKRKDDFKNLIKEAINHAIRKARKKLKPQLFGVRVGPIIVSKLGDKKGGSVYTEEGSFLKAHVQKNARTVYEGKAPSLPRKYIGIEIEFCAPIREEQFVLKLFQNGIHKFAQLKQDGSLRPKEKEFGYELAILLEESNYKKGLKKITDLLASVKAVAKDRRCGLHVHLDMRRRNKDLVYNNLVACQYALLSIVDPTRYNNEFCRLVNTRKFPTEFTGERQERYKTINAAAYYKFRTLEVRMHEGSVDSNEITHWVDLLIKLGNYSKKMKYDVTKLSILQQRLKLKKKLYNYALERSCTWQVQNNEHTREMRNDIGDEGRPAINNRLQRLNDVLNAMPEQATPRIEPLFAITAQPNITTGHVTFQTMPATPADFFAGPTDEEMNEMLDNQEQIAQNEDGN